MESQSKRAHPGGDSPEAAAAAEFPPAQQETQHSLETACNTFELVHGLSEQEHICTAGTATLHSPDG